jgi:hypothetical protein
MHVPKKILQSSERAGANSEPDRHNLSGYKSSPGHNPKNNLKKQKEFIAPDLTVSRKGDQVIRQFFIWSWRKNLQ